MTSIYLHPHRSTKPPPHETPPNAPSILSLLTTSNFTLPDLRKLRFEIEEIIVRRSAMVEEVVVREQREALRDMYLMIEGLGKEVEGLRKGLEGMMGGGVEAGGGDDGGRGGGWRRGEGGVKEGEGGKGGEEGEENGRQEEEKGHGGKEKGGEGMEGGGDVEEGEETVYRGWWYDA